MHNSFTPQHFEKGHKNNLQVKQERTISKIMRIEIYLFRDGKFIPAIYLRPSGKPREKSVHPLLRSQPYQIILIKQGRAGADKAHISLYDAEQLRKFVQA